MKQARLVIVCLALGLIASLGPCGAEPAVDGAIMPGSAVPPPPPADTSKGDKGKEPDGVTETFVKQVKKPIKDELKYIGKKGLNKLSHRLRMPGWGTAVERSGVAKFLGTSTKVVWTALDGAGVVKVIGAAAKGADIPIMMLDPVVLPDSAFEADQLRDFDTRLRWAEEMRREQQELRRQDIIRDWSPTIPRFYLPVLKPIQHGPQIGPAPFPPVAAVHVAPPSGCSIPPCGGKLTPTPVAPRNGPSDISGTPKTTSTGTKSGNPTIKIDPTFLNIKTKSASTGSTSTAAPKVVSGTTTAPKVISLGPPVESAKVTFGPISLTAGGPSNTGRTNGTSASRSLSATTNTTSGDVKIAPSLLRVSAAPASSPALKPANTTVATPSVKINTPTVKINTPTPSVRIATPTPSVKINTPTVRVNTPAVRVNTPAVRIAVPTVRTPTVRVPTVRVPTVRIR